MNKKNILKLTTEQRIRALDKDISRIDKNIANIDDEIHEIREIIGTRAQDIPMPTQRSDVIEVAFTDTHALRENIAVVAKDFRTRNPSISQLASEPNAMLLYALHLAVLYIEDEQDRRETESS